MESYDWPGLKINKELKIKGTWEQVFSLESKRVAAFENRQTNKQGDKCEEVRGQYERSHRKRQDKLREKQEVQEN